LPAVAGFESTNEVSLLISAQIDARSLVPFDCRGVLASVAKQDGILRPTTGSSRNGEEHDLCCKAIIKTTLDIHDSSHPHRKTGLSTVAVPKPASVGASAAASSSASQTLISGNRPRATRYPAPIEQETNKKEPAREGKGTAQLKRLELRCVVKEHRRQGHLDDVGLSTSPLISVRPSARTTDDEDDRSGQVDPA
jgi:hypothetical protein